MHPGTWFIVFLDTGQFFGSYADEADANDRARNVDGVVIPVPILRDFRRADDGVSYRTTDRDLYERGDIPRTWRD